MKRIKVGIVNNLGLAHLSSITNIHYICSKYKYADIFYCTQGNIACMRNEVVKHFLEDKYSHLLFLDSDMIFPDDTIQRLLSWKKDIVSGIYSFKTQPPKPVFSPKQGACIDNGLLEVEVAGAGCLMIKKDVFKTLEPPYFLEESDGSDRIGEDVYFCRKAREAGYKVFIDWNVGCGHISSIVIPPPKYSAS